jgi:glycosyltransferase involved in cell wall biosynthesis
MKISVILPCYNAEATIERQLEALAAQSWSDEWEVVICNNRSTDTSMEIAKGYRGRIKNLSIVDAGEKQGTAYALNAGTRRADGEALLFCDADDVVGSSWLAAMGEALLIYDFVACRTDTTRLNGHLPKRHGYGNPQKNNIQKLWYSPYLYHAGCGTMGIKRSIHMSIGGFDETIPHLFDTDYCIRVQMKKNVQLHYIPDAVLHIGYRQTVYRTYKQSYNYSEYNVFLFSKYGYKDQSSKQLWRKYFEDWQKFFKRLFTRPFFDERYVLSWILGRQIGRIKGCLSYSVPPV